MAPSLSRALAALAHAHGTVEASIEALSDGFSAAVERMDEADRTYRAEIERILPQPKAHELLAAMAAFRASVAELRERARAATGYGEFDPLDTYAPALPGSHAQSVRSASIADQARGEVARMRAEVNGHLGALLDKIEIDHLTEAKRARNAAFDRAIRDVAPTGASDRLATHLMLLADGWY